jgi:MFS family permease
MVENKPNNLPPLLIKTTAIKITFKLSFYSYQSQWPIYASISLGGVQVIMTIVCMFIVDRAGRKKLLFIGMIGMMFSAFSLAIFQTLVIKLYFKNNKSEIINKRFKKNPE